jgi:hypothetical protein
MSEQSLAVSYDEEIALIEYLWDYYSHLMADFECRVGKAIIARQKEAACSHDSPRLARMLAEKWGCVNDPEVNAALADGSEQFRQRVCSRVLSEARDKVVINRCPNCHRVLRTPLARQCFWCGHNWHA